MNRSFMIALTLAACLASPALAQSTQVAQTAVAAPHVDTSLHRLHVDSSHVQPAHFLYRLSMVRDSTTTPIGDQRFAISPIDYAGTPAFELTRDGTEGVAALIDSLVVRRADLRPLHWITARGVARVAAEFTGDTIYGAMSSPLGKQNIVMAGRADLLVNVMAVDVALSATTLTSTWQDSASTLVLDSGGSAIAPALLAVEGEDRVTVPAGQFDCWIVSLETERGSERLWVTKQGQIVVRAEQVLPQLGGATLTRLLVQTDSPALPAITVGSPQ